MRQRFTPFTCSIDDDVMMSCESSCWVVTETRSDQAEDLIFDRESNRLMIDSFTIETLYSCKSRSCNAAMSELHVLGTKLPIRDLTVPIILPRSEVQKPGSAEYPLKEMFGFHKLHASKSI